MINFYANDFGILLRSCAQKNYENPSTFVKVTAKKPVAPFFLDTVYIYCVVIIRTKSDSTLTFGKSFTAYADRAGKRVVKSVSNNMK